MRARIFRSGKRDFECKILEGEQSGAIALFPALGNLLKGKNTLVVGDFVEITDGVITSLLPRSSEVFRILVREQKKKIIASNVDLLVVLTSVSAPAYKRGIIDRFLIRASQWGIKPVVVFNKMDEYDPSEFDIKFEADRLINLGVKCYEISAKNPKRSPIYLDFGLEDFKRDILGRTAIFLGQSGVGKSRTINALGEGSIDLRTHEIGVSNKGSHTTTWAEIVDLKDFTLIDSPGVRSFSLQDVMTENFIELFPDLEEIATHCKFNNCTHAPNSKGCAFYQIEDEYERELVMSRLESFTKIKEEISYLPDWAKK